MDAHATGLVYEVSALVDSELTEAYERYVREQHIPDVLASGCFTSARLVKTGPNRYRALYEVADEATLQQYLELHAPALRADFAQHFPTGVELSRDVWHVLERWSG